MNKEILNRLEIILNEVKYGEVIIKVVDGKVIMIEKKEQFKIQNR